MKRGAVLCGVAMLTLAALGLPADAHAANVQVINNSDWEIHNFFLSSTGEDQWGPDQLGEDIIDTGDSFILNSIPCNTYDVKLVDEDGDECVVEEIDICGGSEQWTITNQILRICQESAV